MGYTKNDRLVSITYHIQKAYTSMTEACDNRRLGYRNLIAGRLYYSVYAVSFVGG